ncbi:hypothetical protein Tco_1269145 [Tanacetum coccineum]
MSDSKHSTVTYTSISSDYEEPSDVGSLGVLVYGYDRLPMHPPSLDYVPGLEHPPSPNYVPGPEHPPSPVYVPYVLEPAYPEFMPPEDDVFPAEEQPLSAAILPTADSPSYITESDPEEDSEEEDPADFRYAAQSTYIIASRSETPPSGTSPLLPIPLPTSSLPLLLPFTDCRADVPEVKLPPQKRLYIAPGPRYEIEESLSAPIARPTGDTWDEMVEAMQEIAPTTLEGVNQRGTDLVTTVRQDTDEVYGRLDIAQDDRSLMSSQLNLLLRDRRSHARTARLMEWRKIELLVRLGYSRWMPVIRRPQTTGIVHRGTDFDEDIADSDGRTTELAETC